MSQACCAAGQEVSDGARQQARDRDVKRLLERYGDVKLTELLAQLENVRSGAPRGWNTKALFEVFGAVESLRATGLRTTAACSVFSREADLPLKVVEKRYAECRRRFAFLIAASDHRYVEIYLRDRPDWQRRLAN